ncbi:MAG: hypothetical protein JWL83_4532 [Actinomycetia bacterium]|nr:hypothetical protein [Actinomycetes bacterium]
MSAFWADLDFGTVGDGDGDGDGDAGVVDELADEHELVGVTIDVSTPTLNEIIRDSRARGFNRVPDVKRAHLDRSGRHVLRVQMVEFDAGGARVEAHLRCIVAMKGVGTMKASMSVIDVAEGMFKGASVLLMLEAYQNGAAA